MGLQKDYGGSMSLVTQCSDSALYWAITAAGGTLSLASSIAKSGFSGNSAWPWRWRRIVLTRCAELYTLLPQTRIDHGRSFDRLRNAGLCHFFFHLAEGGVAKCSFLIFLYHNPVIMTRAARRETVNSDQVSRILELCC